tara:strand:+ start:395 stop:937 length:543 start_codon:yes stop_codon:yes gene_type:complete
MVNILLQAAYVMVPAYFANMAPVLTKRILSSLAKPIDGGMMLGGRPLFGRNKTWRGFLMAVVFSVIITFLQSVFSSNVLFADLGLVPYATVWLPLGILMGVGAIGGDLVESFIKRRLGKEPGKRFLPWDQIDFVLGALILSSLIVDYSMVIILTIIGVSFFGHIIVKRMGYWLKVHDEKW